jgi:ComEC/Rec2-related protein
MNDMEATVSSETVFANGDTDLALIVQGSDVHLLAKGASHPGDIGILRSRCGAAALELCSTNFVPTAMFSENRKQSSVIQTVRKVRSIAKERLNKVDPSIRHWLQAIILGDTGEMTVDERDQFKRTGLLHILIVSGFHVSVFALLFQLFLQAPFRVLYALRLLTPKYWMLLRPMLTLASIFLLTFYVIVLGFSPPSQRAYILFTVSNLSLLFFGALPGTRRMLLACAVQTLAFPAGFVSTSTFLSWVAYLFVIPTADPPKGWGILAGLVSMQLRITVLSVAIFGSLSVIGIFANMVLVPIFPAIYGIAALTLLPLEIGKQWLEYGDQIQRCYIRLIADLSNLSHEYHWLYLKTVPLATQRLGIMLILVLILNQLKKMTIREQRLLKKRSERISDE